MIDRINAAIRNVPDFPKPGIMFKDITPVLRDPELFSAVVSHIAGQWRETELDVVAAVDARGFILGSAVAYELGLGFVPVRKVGKLPWHTVSASYALEYGTSTVEMHSDGVKPGEKILLVDDLLATGGTAAAAASLITGLGATVAGVQFMLELAFLNGREALSPFDVFSMIIVD